MRRYFKCLCQQKITGTAKESERYKLELLMNQAGLTMGAREVEKQAHARSEATGGTGLGLAIVKHIARIHNARIKLESQVDVGTTITGTFPTAS